MSSKLIQPVSEIIQSNTMSEIIKSKTMNKIVESKHAKFIVNFLLATSFAATFIAFFFFTYAKNVERSIVINNVNYTIDDLLSSFLQLIPTPGKKILSKQFDAIDLGDMKSEDDKVIKDNSDLMYGCIKLYGAILIISFILAYVIAKYNNVNFQDILISNIILLVAIAATEYFFLNNVIAKFISSDPNKIKSAIIENL